MSTFLTPLIVSPMPNGRNWKLYQSFSFRIGKPYSRRVVRVPRYFETDFASIPKFLFFLPYWAKFNKSPVLHDWLYHNKRIMGKPIHRKEADEVFLEAMLAEWRFHRSRHYIAFVEYWAVRLLAQRAWSQKKGK